MDNIVRVAQTPLSHNIDVIPLLDSALAMIPHPAIVLTADSEPLAMNRRCEMAFGFTLKQLQYLRKIKRFSCRRHPREAKEGEYEFVVFQKSLRLIGCRFPQNGAGISCDLLVFDRFFAENESQKEPPMTFDALIGKSKVFADTIQTCRNAEHPARYVLLRGESGTGKQALAKCMHIEGPFPAENFICLRNNIEFTEFASSTLDANTKQGADDELAGHTIYIDEMANFNHYNQDKLFHLLRNSAMGGYKVICATSADLGLLSRRGGWHRNLYDILEAERIDVPSLRQRREDIPLLAAHYMQHANLQINRNVWLGDRLVSRMREYDWPGNLYELESFIFSAVRLSSGIDGEVPIKLFDDAVSRRMRPDSEEDLSLVRAERQLIIKALNRFVGHSQPKAAAAQALGIGVATLYRKIERYGIVQNGMFEG